MYNVFSSMEPNTVKVFLAVFDDDSMYFIFLYNWKKFNKSSHTIYFILLEFLFPVITNHFENNADSV